MLALDELARGMGTVEERGILVNFPIGTIEFNTRDSSVEIFYEVPTFSEMEEMFLEKNPELIFASSDFPLSREKILEAREGNKRAWYRLRGIKPLRVKDVRKDLFIAVKNLGILEEGGLKHIDIFGEGESYIVLDDSRREVIDSQMILFDMQDRWASVGVVPSARYLSEKSQIPCGMFLAAYAQNLGEFFTLDYR